MSNIIAFNDANGTTVELTGGKGSNLTKLTQAGFPVPPGFTISTDAYSAFIEAAGLRDPIVQILERVDYDDPSGLENHAAEVRSLIEGAAIPEVLAGEITERYTALGDEVFVAVRSSGTAEDLAEASFAGQHDSYLDIRGSDDVLDAVRRCWASLWTARAVAYRKRGGFDHSTVRIAVVVQKMVASEVSGVMFTANPMTTAVDEYLVNAAWGLGEGIVSGILTPDQFILDRADMKVVERMLGAKEKRVVRDPARGSDTVVEDTPQAERSRFSLTDEQLADLGWLGSRVMEYNGGWPQDLEWGFAEGTFYLLQSRDVTGVDFSWDEDLEDYSELARIPHDTKLSRAFSDSVWQGRVTPLMYSMRGEVFTAAVSDSQRLWGTPEIANMRLWKYSKGEAYYNSQQELANVLAFQSPTIRNPALVQWTPPSWLTDLDDMPGPGWLGYARALARVQLLDKGVGIEQWFAYCRKKMKDDSDCMMGLAESELRKLSDTELKRYVATTVANQRQWVYELWTGFFLNATVLSSAFIWILENWYDGDNPMIFTDLITGLPEPTITLKENVRLWELSEEIRKSDTIRAAYDVYKDGAFFGELENSEDGRAFLAAYQDFLGEFGHRGHADRDMWYRRRSEDPGIDYRTFGVFLSAESEKPGAGEAALHATRQAATEDVIQSIRRQPLGAVKVEVFRYLQGWMLKFFALRDDERHHTDKGTWAKKKAMQEVGRRLIDRGVLQDAEDIFYLSKNESLALLAGAAGQERLTRAKIEARRRNCEAYRKEYTPPMYITGRGVPTTDGEEAASGAGEDGILHGVGTSRGETIGTARVIADQKDLDRVQKGDILVTHSTDPGWTTVFLTLKGLVLETGGMLAHGSCISREYGIPAVQVNEAMSHIPDGATIRVNGDTGQVEVLETPADVVEVDPVPTAVGSAG
jgi:phosphohistidine swiveling domain-containing protein